MLFFKLIGDTLGFSTQNTNGLFDKYQLQSASETLTSIWNNPPPPPPIHPDAMFHLSLELIWESQCMQTLEQEHTMPEHNFTKLFFFFAYSQFNFFTLVNSFICIWKSKKWFEDALSKPSAEDLEEKSRGVPWLGRLQLWTCDRNMSCSENGWSQSYSNIFLLACMITKFTKRQGWYHLFELCNKHIWDNDSFYLWKI